MARAYAILFGLGLLLATPAWAITSATVDRNPVMVGETFNLTLRTTHDADVSPDFSVLERQFRLLNTVSGSEYRLVNGRASRSRHWTTTLVATQPGEYRIPAIAVGAESSDPINIQVLASASGDGPRDAFVEFEADQRDPYLREKVLLTTRLYVSGDLVSGQLGDPVADGAVVEQIGEQTESRAVRDGERYHLFERRYALFPEQAGTLTIEPPQFTGELSTGRRRSSMFNLGQFAGQTRKIYAEADPITLTVQAPPADWRGPWIPASNVELVQTLVPDTGPFITGEPFSRVIELLIDGQLHTQIEPLRPEQPDGVQAYGDPADATTRESAFNVQARIAQQWALIANRPGSLTVPELRFRWWDTDDDSPRETVIPARTIRVEPGAGLEMPPPQTTEPEMQTPGTAPAGEPDAEATGSRRWFWLSGLLAFGWAATACAWAWSTRGRQPRPPAAEKPRPRISRRDVQRALGQRDPALARQVLLNWGRQRHAPQSIVSLDDIARLEGDPELSLQLDALDALLFGTADKPKLWNPDPLIACVGRLPGSRPSRSSSSTLPPLYPTA